MLLKVSFLPSSQCTENCARTLVALRALFIQAFGHGAFLHFRFRHERDLNGLQVSVVDCWEFAHRAQTLAPAA